MIKLANRNVIVMVPVFHSIVRDVDTAIVAKNHVARVTFVDPKCMVINVDAVGSAISSKRFSTVAGFVEAGSANIDIVSIDWVNLNVAVVHRPGVERVDPLPTTPAVFRKINSTVFMSIWALRVLTIGRLAAECSRKICSSSGCSVAGSFPKLQVNVDQFSIARDNHFDGFARQLFVCFQEEF